MKKTINDILDRFHEEAESNREAARQLAGILSRQPSAPPF
jgi:hypothetical protein